MADIDRTSPAKLSAAAIVELPATDERLLNLIETHRAYCAQHTPQASGHAVDPARSDLSELRYFVALEDQLALGCIGLTLIEPRHGEIKTMHVLEAARGKTTGAALLSCALEAARSMVCTRISLETGK